MFAAGCARNPRIFNGWDSRGANEKLDDLAPLCASKNRLAAGLRAAYCWHVRVIARRSFSRGEREEDSERAPNSSLNFACFAP